MNNQTKFYYLIALLIVCFGVGIRLIGLDKGVWMDEFTSINRVTGDSFIEPLRNDHQPPTYFIVLKLWASINDGEVFLRLLSVFFSTLSMIVFMAWLKYYSITASLLGGFLFSTTPILIRYAQEIRAYSLLLLATVFSLYCITQILKEDRNKWYGFLSIGLCFVATTHTVGIVVLASIGIYFFTMLLIEKKPIRWVKIVLPFLLPMLLFFMISFFFFNDLYVDNWWMPPLSLDLFRSQFELVFGIDKLLFPVSWLGGYSFRLALLYKYGLIALSFLAGVALLLWGDWRKSGHLLFVAISYWLMVVLISIFFVPIFWFRMLIPGILPFIGFIAIHVSTVRIKKVRVVLIALVCLLSLLSTVGWINIEAGIPLENWRQAAEFLEQEYQPNDLVVFYPHYAKGPILYYFNNLDEEKIEVLPGQITPEDLAVDFQNQINSHLLSDSPTALYLVVRHDRTVDLNQPSFNNILAYLERTASFDYLNDSFGIIKIYRFQIK